MSRYQVAIIGAGPGGYVAAIKAAQLGLNTVVIEQAEIGGTCLNRGCVPTKTVLYAADLLEESHKASTFGLSIPEATVNYPTLRARKETVVDQLRRGVEKLLEANGVDIVRGKAFIEAADRIKIQASTSSSEIFSLDTSAKNPHTLNQESYVIEADNIIVAAGTSPALPPLKGINLPGVYTSDSILAALPEIKRLVIIGGGIIGMEFAGIYTAFGTHVTVLEAAHRITSLFDRELSQTLSMMMKQKGCTITSQAFVLGINKDAQSGSLSVSYEVKGETHQVETDAVLIATGRTSDIDALFSETAKPACYRGRITVDPHMRTSIKGIFAIGDISAAGPQLAHAASAQGIVAASAIAGESCSINLNIIPSCIYTSPEIACVGLTEAEAKEAGFEVKVGKYSLAGNAKTIISNQSRSFVKIVSDKNGTILGAQLMCARATDIIGEFAVAISTSLKVSQMQDIVRPHPTFEEAISEALEAIAGSPIHVLPRK